jgi:hypothetical protein
VKEIRYGRANALDETVQISDQTLNTVTVILSTKGGQLEGNLTDALAQPAGGARVVLIPDQRDKRSLFKEIAADPNGHFVFRMLPPGGYKVFSWEALESGAYYDSDVLSRYESNGRPVRIQESSKETMDLKVIPAPQQ